MTDASVRCGWHRRHLSFSNFQRIRMSYQVLARKWRPQSFPEMVGQAHVVRALTNALEHNRLHHAYLFTGTRGVGKTTIARILAKSLNCETKGVTAYPCGECHACLEVNAGRFIDLIEVDAASRTKVEDTRELLENVQYAPTRGRYKVYLIDEVHMLSTNSFNALLKTLEEPPSHVKFLLATTDPQKLPPTILSRCLQFNLKRLPQEQIYLHLAKILQAEEIAYEDMGLHLLSQAADGSLRDALSLLDQAIAFSAGKVIAEDVNSMLGTLDQNVILNLMQALATADASQVLQQVAQLAEQNPDFVQVLNDLLAILQQIAIAQFVPEAIDKNRGDVETILKLAQQLSKEDVQLFYQIGLIGRRDLPLSPDLRGGFEMVLLRMLAFQPATSQSANVTTVPPVHAVSVAPQTSVSAQHSQPPPSRISPTLSPSPPVNVSTNHSTNNEWTQILNILPLSGTGLIQQLAIHCEYKKRQANTLHLAIAPGYSTHKRKEKELEQLVQQHYNKELKLEISVEEPQTETFAQQQQRVQQSEQQAIEAEISSDPFVTQLQQQCDAKINKITHSK